MSIAVVGIDLGTQSFVLGQAKRGGIDVILNESSKRLNASMVSFLEKERYLGDNATTQVRTNMKNTVTQVKRVLGRKFNDADVQDEVDRFICYNNTELPNGEIGAEVAYNDDTAQFTTTQITSMILTKAKEIVAFNNPGVTSIEAVISVPSYYTAAQRKAVREAAQITGIHCLRVIPDGTAAALSYGIFKAAKKEFPEGTQTKVLFLDMGFSQFTVTAAAYTNSSVRIIGSACDPTIGGREIDYAIAKYFAEEYKAKTGLDAWTSKKARSKLLAAAEKAKTSISPHGVNHTPVSIECLVEEKDFNGSLTYEKLNELIGERFSTAINTTIKKVLAATGATTYSDFSLVELVGGSMRPRLVKRAAAEALGLPIDEANGHGLSQSLNLDECVARGCALSAAALSAVFKVKPFDVIDYVTAPVTINWTGAAAAVGDDDAMEDGESSTTGQSSQVLFKTGDAFPVVRRVTFARNENFTVSAFADANPTIAGPAGDLKGLMATFNVSGFPEDAQTPNLSSKTRLDFKYDLDGQISIVKAEFFKEVPLDEEAAAAAAAAAAADPAAAPKKKYRRSELIVSSEYTFGLPSDVLAKYVQLEKEMEARDADIHATQDMRNSLETYIYNTRDELADSLRPFAKDDVRADFEEKLNAMETWLYDEGFDSDKLTYAAKLESLKAIGNPIFARKWESDNRYAAVAALTEAIEHYRAVRDNKTGAHGHLVDADKDTLKAATHEAEQWLADNQKAQSNKEMYEDPAFSVAQVNAKREALIAELHAIENRPPPAPLAPEEIPKDESMD